MKTEQKIQTLWGQIKQSQSIEEERSNVDEFRDFLKSKSLSFTAWHLLKSGEKKHLNKVVNANKKETIHIMNIEVFVDKTALQLAYWKPLNSENVWRLYFE